MPSDFNTGLSEQQLSNAFYRALNDYTDAQIDSLLSGKVNKETGKGLSTNDFTDAEKTKLSNLSVLVAGSGVSFGSNGEINLTPASSESIGGVKVGSNINVGSDGTVSVPNADSSTYGVVQVESSVQSGSGKVASSGAVYTAVNNEATARQNADSGILEEVATKTTLGNVYGLGTSLSAPSNPDDRIDLDTFTSIGVYSCGLSVSSYVVNRPEINGNSGFTMLVHMMAISGRLCQIFMYNNAVWSDSIFIRYKTSSTGWNPWRRYTGDVFPYAPTNTELALSCQPRNYLKTFRSSRVASGVTIRLNSDGTYTLNGTASAGLSVPRTAVFADLPSSWIGKQVTMTGGVSSGIKLVVYTSTSGSTVAYSDTGDGVTFTLTQEMVSTPYDIRIAVTKNTVCEDVIVKPMIRLADISDSTFVPYIPDNTSLYSYTQANNLLKLSGSSYIALGDSIVDYQGVTGSPHTNGYVYGYIEAMEMLYKVICTNLGNAGHTLTEDLSDLLAVSYSSAKIVTIGYGVNDARLATSATPLGTEEDVYDAEHPTFCGAMNALLAKIYTDNPTCNVIVLAPIQRAYTNNFGSFTPNANGDTLEDYANACVKTAGRNATPCVDLFHTSGINSSTYSGLLKDGVHPNSKGYVKMFAAMKPIIDGLISASVVE